MSAIARPGGEKSYERALFPGERAFFVRIVAFGLVPAGPFNVLHRMDQVAVRNHGMMGGFLELSCSVVLGRDALVLRRMLQKFGGFQVMIDALLRHVFRITNGPHTQARTRPEPADYSGGCAIS